MGHVLAHRCVTAMCAVVEI